MIYYNNKSNLLEDIKYHYELQDVAEPELYRELYDYESIPKIAFNNRHVPINMPDEIWMTDTTFRDGQQSTSPFTVKQIVDLYKLMSRLGGPKGLVRQSEFFIYSKKDKDALHACQDTGLKFPEITTWIRANAKDFELVKEAGVAETGILVSCSDYHIFKKMHLTRRQALDQYLGIVKSALSIGIRPRCHFEDITRADVLIIAGTSLAVYPAAMLPDYFRGGELVLLNKTPTARDGIATLAVYGDVADTVRGLSGS